jgi:hypothetical protein
MKPHYLKAILIAAIVGMACTTKVSEWVLLNSFADKYRLVYYHKGDADTETVRQNKEMESLSKTANIVFRTEKKEDIAKPYYALYYGNRLFGQYNDQSSLKDIAVSPLREKVVEELMAGKLCVMLYLRSGSSEKDEKGLQVITRSLDSSPFRDIITLMETERGSQSEKHLVSLLLNVESDLKDINEPMLFGVFGRFRALEPLLGRGITEENIHLLIDFLTADCSCLIKDQLPGVSILCKADWERPKPALVNAVLDANPFLMHK